MEAVSIHIPRASSLDLKFSKEAWELLSEEQQDDVIRTMAANFYRKNLNWKVTDDNAQADTVHSDSET